MERKIIVIVGPTAAGKTEYSISLAKAFGGEIISADSMQIYKLMDIGSAKPSLDQQKTVKHHLIDIVDPKTSFTVAQYQQTARACIDRIISEGKLPIVTGGTGLYINSILYDMDFSSEPGSSELRKYYEEAAYIHGRQWVHERLRCLDKDAAQRIHPNNLKRVIRAIEILEKTGKPADEFSKSFKNIEGLRPIIIGITRNRKELYDKIDERVDLFMRAGLIDEVRNLLETGLSLKHQSMQGIGYKESIGYLEGEYSLKEAVRLIKRNTRRYAKRQLTWFHRIEGVCWFNISEFQHKYATIEAMIKFVEENLREEII